MSEIKYITTSDADIYTENSSIISDITTPIEFHDQTTEIIKTIVLEDTRGEVHQTNTDQISSTKSTKIIVKKFKVKI